MVLFTSLIENGFLVRVGGWTLGGILNREAPGIEIIILLNTFAQKDFNRPLAHYQKTEHARDVCEYLNRGSSNEPL